MTRLLLADSGRLEEILDGTYSIWGEALSRPSYGAWNRAQMSTEWGRENLRRVALVLGETLLASAKRYDFHAQVAGTRAAVLGIGGVFTPVGQRGRGHARELIARMLDDAVDRGCRYALLFSEIGSEYYASMGFHVVPRLLSTIQIRRKPGAPATFVRSGEPADLPWIAEISARYSSQATGAGFALDRSPQLIEFGFARRRLLAGLGPPGLRRAEFFVAEEGRRPVAYVFMTTGPRGAVLEECGDRDPTGARIGAILQVLAARTPAEPATLLTGWLPDDLRPVQVDVSAQAPAAEIMMLRALGASTLESALQPVVYWQSDAF